MMVVFPNVPFRRANQSEASTRAGAALKSACLIALGLLSACSYRGGIEQPLTQKVAWFSYLNGDDIRAACVPGAATSYRIVYNGEYDRQVRAYEVLGDPGGGSYAARVQTGGGINPLRLSLTSLEGAAGWTTARARLDGAQMAELERALERSGAFRAAPAGLSLASEEFYWLFVGCRKGRVHFNAWRFPSDGFARLAFPVVLLRHDATGIAVNPPRDVGPIERGRRGPLGENPTPRFDLAIGPDGLLGLGPRL